jgi:hypothetical protein
MLNEEQSRQRSYQGRESRQNTHYLGNQRVWLTAIYISQALYLRQVADCLTHDQQKGQCDNAQCASLHDCSNTTKSFTSCTDLQYDLLAS